ncbi:MAG: 4Fe-4S dicluster domain-containing protein [Planctomycetes bacterium]|nr:4Fe-4S dicluster domain-containing protein [Planctomycetota bacterium]
MKGFNLFKAYPVSFPDKIETIQCDVPETEYSIPIPNTKVENIIVTLCPTEPWALPAAIAMENNVHEFLSRLLIIRTQLFGESHCHIVISTHDTGLVRVVRKFEGSGDWLHTHMLEPIYPYDEPVLLLNNILGISLAPGQDNIEEGVLLLDAQAVTGIFENHIQGGKYRTRLIPISGTGLIKNKILRLPPGTPLNVLLEGNVKKDITCRVFVNGPLNGSEVTDFRHCPDLSIKNIVVLEEKDYKTAFPFLKLEELLFTTSMMGELRRCVSCNYCDDICPMDLEPALFWNCHTRGERHRAYLYRLEKCIECGLCSFVCPSKLELLQVIKECKSHRVS